MYIGACFAYLSNNIHIYSTHVIFYETHLISTYREHNMRFNYHALQCYIINM